MTTATRADWLAERRTGLGSSDAAAILGEDPYRTALDVYCDKLGLREESEEEAEYLYWGHAHEPAMAARFAELTGRTMIDPGDFHIDRHPEYPFLVASVDRFQVPDPETEAYRFANNGRGVLELKTCNAFKRSDWRDAPPLNYQIQVQHQMLVTGCTWGTIAVLIGGNQFVWHDVEAHLGFQDRLLASLKDFWRRIEERDPPPATYRDMGALQLLHPDDSGETVELPEEAAEWDTLLGDLRQQKKSIERREAELKAKIAEAIGGATWGVIPGVEGRWQWKTEPRAGHVVAPSKPRVLRRLKK